jgi:hypothetical protein
MKCSACYCFHIGSLLGFSSTLKMEAIRSPKHRLTFDGLHGVVSQEIELFIKNIDYNNSMNMLHQPTQTENTIWTFIPQTDMRAKHRMWECGLDSSGSRQGPTVGSCVYWVWGFQSGDYDQYYFLKMEVICSSETSVNFHRTAWYYMSEDSTLQRQKSLVSIQKWGYLDQLI